MSQSTNAFLGIVIGLAVVALVVIPATQSTDALGDAPVETEGLSWFAPEGGIPLVRRCDCTQFQTLGLLDMAAVNARTLSNQAFGGPTPDSPRLSSFVWQWGQFIDHDIVLSESATDEPPIRVSVDDAQDPFAQAGISEINVTRAATVPDANGCRVQRSATTGFVDGSQIYGNTEALNRELRTLAGDGRLKSQHTPNGEFMPLSETAPHQDWLAGDPRAAETVTLAVMHTLFVRVHNQWAHEVRLRNPHWTGDQIYHKARQLTVAQLQVITWTEWLPALLGAPLDLDLAPVTVDAAKTALFQEFASSAFRFGHSQVANALGATPLADLFFTPATLLSSGLEPWLSALWSTPSSRVDAAVVPALRNFLFGSVGMDLITLNLVRGRDLELPTFEGYSRCVAQEAPQLGGDRTDLFQGLLSQPKPNPQAVLPPLVAEIVALQFKRLAEGDQHFYLRQEAAIGPHYWPRVAGTTLRGLLELHARVEFKEAAERSLFLLAE